MTDAATWKRVEYWNRFRSLNGTLESIRKSPAYILEIISICDEAKAQAEQNEVARLKEQHELEKWRRGGFRR